MLAERVLARFCDFPGRIMSRLTWLVLFCLAAIGCLTVVRFIIGSGAAEGLPSHASEVIDTGKTLPKGDRLPTVPATLRENYERDVVANDARREDGLLALKKAAAAARVSTDEPA